MVLEGMVPVLMHTPPTTERASTTATRLFILDAATAARWPAGPEPMTTRSYLRALMRVCLPTVVFPSSGRGAVRILSPVHTPGRSLPGGYHSTLCSDTAPGHSAC